MASTSLPARLPAAVLGLCLLAAAAPPRAGTPERIAVLNWDLAQTVIALGVDPVAVADAAGYRKWVAAPALPHGTVAVGRRIEPNLDALAAAAPGLILVSGYLNRGRDQLEGIAPTETYRIYRPGGEALERSLEVAARLADRLDRQAHLERLRARLDRAVDTLQMRTRAGESVYVIRFRGAGHIQVFGRHGLFDGVLRRAGLDNAWDGPSNYWGFAMAAIEELDAAADHLVVLEPVPRVAEAMMRDSPIWQALPAVREGRVHRLGPIWNFGSVPSATRFAELLAAAIHDDR